MNDDDRYARRYFTALGIGLLVILGLIIWGHAKPGTSHDRDISDLTHALECDQYGLTVAECEMTR